MRQLYKIPGAREVFAADKSRKSKPPLGFDQRHNIHSIRPIFTFQADVGQDEDFEEARQKATKLGAKKVGRIAVNCHVLKVYMSL